jgi:hypothetical protein
MRDNAATKVSILKKEKKRKPFEHVRTTVTYKLKKGTGAKTCVLGKSSWEA